MRPYLCAVVVLFCFGKLATAEAPKDIAARLSSQLLGKACILAQPQQGKKLRFSEDGTLLSRSAPGTWPAHAGFLIDSVRANKTRLQLKGKRVLIFFDTGGKRQAAATSNDLEIEIQLGLRPVDEAVGRILMVTGSSPADVAPPTVASPAAAGLDDSVTVLGKMPDGAAIYRVSRRVHAPRVIRAPDPHYPEGLRNSGATGTALLRIVVDADGTVHSIKVEKTEREGFEVAAADAVKDWMFTPAVLDGQPVAVVINVEVNFRLY